MLFEHEADRPSVQHHPRDPASVNAMKQTCVIVILAYFTLLYTYKKYPLILPIFLHINTKFCITLLAFSDSVSPSSIFYPRRSTVFG